MAYWGGGPKDNDYADVNLGATLLDLKERMFKSTLGAIKDLYPEQALVAHLRALRAISDQFPKIVPHLTFTVEDLERAENLFHEWYSKVERKIPPKYRARIQKDAQTEFRAFRALLGVREPGPTDRTHRGKPPRIRARKVPAHHASSSNSGRKINGTARMVETDPGDFSLLLNAETTVDKAARALGYEPTGYFWERVAMFLAKTEAPHLKGRFAYDCESSMFCAHGADQLALQELRDLLNPVVVNAARLKALVMKAKKQRHSLDDD